MATSRLLFDVQSIDYFDGGGAGALAAVLPEALGREVLALEATIYGAGAGAGVWHGDGLKALLPELERLGGADQQAKNEPLLPLYR